MSQGKASTSRSIVKHTRALTGKVLHFIAITIVVITLAIAYIASLIIVKPRELTFIDSLIEQSLLEYHHDAKVNIKSSMIAWDKNSFSFNINLYDVSISIPNKFESYTPHVVIDVFRRDLLRGKLTLDRAILTSSKITIHNKPNTHNSTNIANVKIPVFFNNIELYSSKINFSDSKLYIKELILEKTKHLKSHYIETESTILYGLTNIELSIKCSIKKSILEDCDGNFFNLNNEILESLAPNTIPKNSNFNIKGSFRANLNKTQNAHIKIFSENGMINHKKLLPIKWDNFYSDISIGLNDKDIKLNQLKISQGNNTLELTGHYNSTQKKLTLSGNATQIAKDYILSFWPDKFANKLLWWLTSQTNNIIATNAKVKLDLSLEPKKLNTLNLAFDFDNATIDFSNALKPLTQASGNFALTNNLISIYINKGKLSNINLDSATAFIDDALGRKTKNILIKFNSKTNAANITEYLFNNDFADFHFSGLSDNIVSINVPIVKNTKLRDITFKADTVLDGLNFDYIAKDSKLKMSLTKDNNNSNIIKSEIYCIDCKPDVPLLQYNNNIISTEKFNFTIDADPKRTRIFDIKSSGSKQFKLNANLAFEDQKLAELNISNSLVGNSDISYSYNNLLSNKVIIRSNNTYLSLDKLKQFLTNSNNNSNGSKQIFDVQINNVYYENKLIGNNLAISGYTSKSNDIIHYLNLPLSGGKGALIAKQKTATNNTKITDIDIENFGQFFNDINVTSQIVNGKITANLTTTGTETSGIIYTNNFAVKTNNFLNKIYELTSFRRNNLDQTSFTKGSGRFKIKQEKVEIEHFSCYGNNIGITASGHVDFKKNYYDINGVIIPATTINTLLGIRYIPIIGNLVTGGKDEGLISASYQTSGQLGVNPKLKVNPFSTLTPGFLRQIFHLTKPNNKNSQDN